MQEIKTLNKIDPVVNGVLKGYAVSDDAKEPVGILVRSAKLHDMEFPESLLAIARAGAGVNNIPLDRCAAEGICVFNTPGANANAVKELVFAAIMMVNRNLVEAIDWCKGLAGDPDAAAKVEKGKNQFVGPELAPCVLPGAERAGSGADAAACAEAGTESAPGESDIHMETAQFLVEGERQEPCPLQETAVYDDLRDRRLYGAHAGRVWSERFNLCHRGHPVRRDPAL